MSTEEEGHRKIKEMMTTAPADPRFQEKNATYYCYTMFIDFHRCIRLLGSSHEPCQMFKRTYTSICPNSWVEKWEEQIEKDTFPATLPPRQ